MSKLRPAISAILTAAGLFGFLGGGLVAFAGDHLPLSSIEFPLGDIQDIAVDPEGNILLALGFYGRIQLYDAAGHFQRGWSADSRGGSFTVVFRSGGIVASHAVRRGSTVLFDLSGRRLSETTADPLPEYRGPSLSVSAPDGSTLRVRDRILWPKLVREKDGVTSTVLTGPWYLRTLTGPFPA